MNHFNQQGRERPAVKHRHFYVNLEEWFADDENRTPAMAMFDIQKRLVGLGMKSLEEQIGLVLKDFVGVFADQKTIIESQPDVDDPFRLTQKLGVTCLRTSSDDFVFLDLDRPDGSMRITHLEFDVFAGDEERVTSISAVLVQESMKCFGLTFPKESLVIDKRDSPVFATGLRDKLRSGEPTANDLFQRLQNESERALLRELRKKGSILERDLHELVPSGTELGSVNQILDYFSGEEHPLVERNLAIVCIETGNLIFSAPQKADLEEAKNWECPKCGRSVADEEIMARYDSTKRLESLIDGNKWMPMLIREAFVKAGVPRDDVLIEVKYDEDETDVLVFYRMRIFVIEAKNRPANLGDVYKLSSKASRLDAVAKCSLAIDQEAFSSWREPFDSHFEYEYFGHSVSRASWIERETFVPIMISTHGIAKDAQAVLTDISEDAKFLEYCDHQLERFAQRLIDDIDESELDRRLVRLITPLREDSIARLAAEQIFASFVEWCPSLEWEPNAFS